MKKICYKFFAFLLFLLSFYSVESQNDTLLVENFQADPTENMLEIPNGNDTLWINYDEDGIAAANGLSQKWFFAPAFPGGRDSTTANGSPNYVLRSSSWLDGDVDGNRNWLILKPLRILTDKATLHFKSAPSQAPLYLDGFSVLISETTNAAYDGVFVDTVFHAAQMTDYFGDETSLDLADFEFSEGYIHADSLRDTLYAFIKQDSLNNPAFVTQMQPHSISLAAYAGKTIYIAFLHDSDDDNLLELDDILVLGNKNPTAISDISKNVRFVTYPNPFISQLNVMYRLEQSAEVGLEMRDVEGKLVGKIASHRAECGEHQHQLSLSNIPSGTYQLILNIDNQVITKNIVKQ